MQFKIDRFLKIDRMINWLHLLINWLLVVNQSDMPSDSLLLSFTDSVDIHSPNETRV